MRPLLAVLPFVAAPLVAAASPMLPIAGWWEKITVTMSGDGKAQSCKYETSKTSSASPQCQVVGGSAAGTQPVATKADFATIIFERRFSPGAVQPLDGALQPGDTLLGRQVMALAIDPAGKVSGCKVVATAGDMGLDYGCPEASAERFEANPSPAKAEPRQGFMTVRIYGHAEHVA